MIIRCIIAAVVLVGLAYYLCRPLLGPYFTKDDVDRE